MNSNCGTHFCACCGGEMLPDKATFNMSKTYTVVKCKNNEAKNKRDNDFYEKYYYCDNNNVICEYPN